MVSFKDHVYHLVFSPTEGRLNDKVLKPRKDPNMYLNKSNPNIHLSN